jgi:hypothetical protein
MSCNNGTGAATYRLEGDDDAHLVTVGSLVTSVDSEGTSRWAFKPLPEVTPSMDGKLPQYFSAQLKPMSAAEAPADLVASEFPRKSDMGAYDGLHTPPAGGCLASPGPADSGLHCVRTTSPSWIGYRWYKFVEQPAFQRVNLSAAEAHYLQARVEKLHDMLAKGGAAAGEWIKQRGAVEQLATVDGAQLVTPPKGLERGYVPIAVYEGSTQPAGCVSSTAPPAASKPVEAVEEPIEAAAVPAKAAEAAAVATPTSEGCTSDIECSLNGACRDGACVCDPGWIGTSCSALDLLPARKAAGYKMPGRSSWGGSVIRANGTYHMFVEELVNGCGLNTYARNMRIAHAISESGRADGPYQPVNLVTSFSASTPHALRDPSNGDWLVFGTGCGREACLAVTQCHDGITHANADMNPCPNRTAAAGAPPSVGHAQPCTCPAHGAAVPGPECAVDWGTNVWRSRSADGPWDLTAPLLDVVRT